MDRISTASQLWILLDQRSRSQHSRTADHRLQFQCIHCGFALDAIIGDHIRGLGASGDALDSFFPAGKFPRVVEIVVTVVAIVGGSKNHCS